MSRKSKNYKVGHGNPPKHSQFKKGQSGNPKGRPKTVDNFNYLFEKVFLKKNKVRINGVEVEKHAMEIGLIRLREDVMKGNYRAMRLVIGLAQQSGLMEKVEIIPPPLPSRAEIAKNIELRERGKGKKKGEK